MLTVSVIMPAYNAGPFIADAVESVLAQTGVDFELLVADDGSTDDTGAILARHAADPRVRLTRNPRTRGAAATRNALLRAARGRYVTPCDADDLLLPGNLSRQADYLDQHPEIGVVYANTLMLRLDGAQRLAAAPEILGQDCNHTWDLRENVVNHGGSMSRRALVEQVGGYDESAPTVDDWSLWLKMAEITRIHFLAGEVLYVWRRHHPSLSSVAPNRAAETEQIIRAAALRRLGR